MTDQEPPRGLWKSLRLDKLPATLFGGRLRTSTFILVLAWILAYIANAQLNWVEPQSADPVPSVSTSVVEQSTAPPVVTSTTFPVPESESASTFTPPPSSSTLEPSSPSTSGSPSGTPAVEVPSTEPAAPPLPNNLGETTTDETTTTTPSPTTTGTG